jgi:hypothetical protein
MNLMPFAAIIKQDKFHAAVPSRQLHDAKVFSFVLK